ncbi:unnamed protein product [Mortierella alpina]
MAKAFHGRIEDTRDALIVLEACRQGLLPRINRRLLAAEREGAIKSEPYDESSGGPATRTRQAHAPNPSLIEAGSVFVFDEYESGIYRWTDGRIWSPSRICGNFLVYRELYRKLPDQKCWTAKDKAGMKDGNALKDKTLKETVKKENLVVLGCMKGTFVLKKDGLVKKTICVTGVELPPPEELQNRSNVTSRLRPSRGAASSRPPGFKLAGIQHLVCYERPGAAISNLHRPRDYVQLRDLPISKTFVLAQKYRNPLRITPLPSDQMPVDPWDEYIDSERIIETRNSSNPQTRPKRSKPSVDDNSGNASSNDFMSGEYVQHHPREPVPAATSASHKIFTVSHPYSTRRHSHQFGHRTEPQVTSRITRNPTRSLRRSTRHIAPMDSDNTGFSTQRKRRSASVTSSDHGIFIKDEEFSSSSTSTPVCDAHHWMSISSPDSQLELHGVKFKDGQWELRPFSDDADNPVEATSSIFFPPACNHAGFHDGRTLAINEEQETARRATWMAEPAEAAVHTPNHEFCQQDRSVSLLPAVPSSLTKHPGDQPATGPEASEDWHPSGTPSPEHHAQERMRIPSKSVSAERDGMTSSPVLPSLTTRDETSPGTNEPAFATKSSCNENSPSAFSSSVHSEQSYGLSLSSSLSLSPACKSSCANSPSAVRSPRSNIQRRSESKTPLSPMYEHEEIEDSAVTSAAMILTSALSDHQLSHKTLNTLVADVGTPHLAASPATSYPPMSPLLSQAEWRGALAGPPSENYVWANAIQHMSDKTSNYVLPPVMHMMQQEPPLEQPSGFQQHLSGSINATASVTAIPPWSPSPTPAMHQRQHLNHERSPLPEVSSQHFAIEREFQQYHLRHPQQQPQQQMGLATPMQYFPAQPFTNVRLVSGYRTMHPSGGTNDTESMKDPIEAHVSMGSETSLAQAASFAGSRPHGLDFQDDHTLAQASDALWDYRMDWNQIQAVFEPSSTPRTCSYSTAAASGQVHGPSPASSGLAYDSSTSFTGAADSAPEPRASQRRYMSPSSYLFAGACSSAPLDRPRIPDTSSSAPTPYSRDMASMSRRPSCTSTRRSSDRSNSTVSEDSQHSTQLPASDTHPYGPGESYQQEKLSCCSGESLGYVFDQEPLGGAEASFYTPDTRDQPFDDSTPPDQAATSSCHLPQLTPGTLSAMHPSATDDSARSAEDLEVSADESLGKAEYLLHTQHSRLSQFSQLPSDPSSDARQDPRSDRFSDDNQPWALRRHEDAAQDMFPGLIDLRPRSSAYESSASEDPRFGGALEQEEFLEDRLERERLERARAMAALNDDDGMSSGSELTDGTRSDDTRLLYSPTPA